MKSNAKRPMNIAQTIMSPATGLYCGDLTTRRYFMWSHRIRTASS